MAAAMPRDGKGPGHPDQPGYKLSRGQSANNITTAPPPKFAPTRRSRKQDIGEARAAFNDLSLRERGRRPDRFRPGRTGGRRVPGRRRSRFGRARLFQLHPQAAERRFRPPAARRPDPAIDRAAGRQCRACREPVLYSKGYTPEQSAGIVGNLVHESGMNPFASGDARHLRRAGPIPQRAAGKPAGLCCIRGQTRDRFPDPARVHRQGAARLRIRDAGQIAGRQDPGGRGCRLHQLRAAEGLHPGEPRRRARLPVPADISRARYSTANPVI